MRKKTAFYRFSGILLFVLLLTALAISSLIGTQWGTRIGVDRLVQLSDGKLSIAEVSGTLGSTLVLQNIRYRGGSFDIQVNRLQLHMALLRLLIGEVGIQHSEVDTLVYRPVHGTPLSRSTEKPFQMPRVTLPVSLSVRDLEIGQIEIQGEPERQLKDIRIAGSLRDSQLTLKQLQASLNGLELGINGQASLPPDLSQPVELWLQLHWHYDGPGSRKLEGSGRVQGHLGDLQISHELRSPFRVETRGHLDLEGAPHLELETTSAQIDLNDDGLDTQLILNRLNLTGWVDAYQVRWQGELKVGDLPPAPFQAYAEGDTTRLEVRSFELVPQQSLVKLSGTIDWGEEMTWFAQTTLKNIDPALFFPDWPGSIDGSFRVRGSQNESGSRLHVNAMKLHGKLLSLPFTATGDFWLRPDGVQFEDVQLVSGTDYLKLEGRVDSSLSLAIDTQITDLNAFTDLLDRYVADEQAAALAGSVHVKGRIDGTRVEPRFSLTLQGRNLTGFGYSAQQLDASGELNRGVGASPFKIRAKKLWVGRRSIEDVAIDIQGTLEQHRLNAEFSGSGFEMRASLAGRWDSSQWQGRLLDSAFSIGPAGTWQQSGGASLVISPHAMGWSATCWSQGTGSACFQMKASPDSLSGALDLNAVSIAAVTDLLPPGSAIEGALGGQVKLSGTADMPRVEFKLGLPVLKLSYSDPESGNTNDAEEQVIATELHSLSLEGGADRASIQARVTFVGVEQSEFEFNGSMTDWFEPKPAVSGTLQAKIPDIAFVAILLPDVSNITGSLNVNLAVNGALAQPELKGSISLERGRAEIVEAGVQLTDIELQLRPVNKHRMKVSATARSGGGQIDLQGGVELDAGTGWPFQGSLKGTNLLVLNRSDLTLFVSPDLNIEGNLKRLKLNGRVDVPRGRVTLHKLPPQAVDPSPDVVVAGKPAGNQTRTPVLNLSADLDVELGNEVHFEGFGLSADLAGQLALRARSDYPTTGQGRVMLTSGKFNAYGRELKIAEGRLVFTGPLDDPILDIDAERQIDDITVGIHLEGTGQAPLSRLYSKPPMPEADALSYLIIGRPLAEATGGEGADIQQSAIALGLQQAIPIVDQIGRSLGLDDVGIDTASTGTIMAGKQIGHDLYVRYSYGLFNRIGSLLLRYQLGRHVSLEVQASEDQTLDLLYTREK